MRPGFFIYNPIISYAIIAYPFPEYPMQKLHSWGLVCGRAHPNRGTRPTNVFVVFTNIDPPFCAKGSQTVYILSNSHSYGKGFENKFIYV
jgi:hypothetical protein